MVQPITEHHTVVRPTMIPVPKVPGNRGTDVIMVRTGNYDPEAGGDPPAPEPEREPLAVVQKAEWDGANDYSQGATVTGRTATYSGGDAASTTYRWRFQTKGIGEDTWINTSWTNYSNEVVEASYLLTSAGQVRFQCQARDTSLDPVEQSNSFCAVKNVTAPTTIGEASVTVNDLDYDHSEGPALTVLMNDPMPVVVTIDGDADATYSWSARNDYPLMVSEQAASVILTLPQAGGATVTCTISDPNATDGPKSVAINFYVVDAKTWQEFQANKNAEPNS